MEHTSKAVHCSDITHSEALGARICNTLQHTATHCNTLQYAATHYNTLQHSCRMHDINHSEALCSCICKTLQHTATNCSMLQHTALQCNALQHAATPFKLCNTPEDLQYERSTWRPCLRVWPYTCLYICFT